MKFYGLILFVLLGSVSCRTLSYYSSPNSLRNIDGTLYLRNGKSITGKLIVQTDNVLGSPVKLFMNGDERPMQFSLSSVRAFTIGAETYELKEIKDGLPLGRQLFFMRRMTPEDGRIRLYEHMQKHTVNKTSVRYEPEYYVQLPGEENDLVHASTGSKFVPGFDQKASLLVSDCDELARKIREKKEGYYYHQVSLVKEKRLEVLMKIVTEYNQCEKRTGNGE